MQVFFFLLAAVSITVNFWFMMQLSNRQDEIDELKAAIENLKKLINEQQRTEKTRV
jgi:Tfp pilus assembly protein PilO